MEPEVEQGLCFDEDEDGKVGRWDRDTMSANPCRRNRSSDPRCCACLQSLVNLTQELPGGL